MNSHFCLSLPSPAPSHSPTKAAKSPINLRDFLRCTEEFAITSRIFHLTPLPLHYSPSGSGQKYRSPTNILPDSVTSHWISDNGTVFDTIGYLVDGQKWALDFEIQGREHTPAYPLQATHNFVGSPSLHRR